MKRLILALLPALLAVVPAAAQFPRPIPTGKAPKSLPHIVAVKLATGETARLLFVGDTPMPAESKLALCRRAGSEIDRQADGFRFNWAFELVPVTHAVSLRSVTGVKVEEVSRAKVIPVFAGKPEFDGENLVIFAPGDLISKERYPWLYDKEPTTFIFRITLDRPEHDPDVLIQPLRVEPTQKKAFKQAGYLPKAKKEAGAPAPPKG